MSSTEQRPQEARLSPAFVLRKVREKGLRHCLKAALRHGNRRFLAAVSKRFLLISLGRAGAARLRCGIADPRLAVRHCLAWTFYSKVVAVLSRVGCGRITPDADFGRTGIKQGVLPPDVLQSLRVAIDCCPTGPILQEDFSSTYVHHNGLRAYEATLNRDHTYVQMEHCPVDVLQRTLEVLARPVAACLGSRWRTLNVRCWRTRPGAAESGPNAWHRDGFPDHALKLMIYLTGANGTIGTTEIERKDGARTVVEGPEGTWLLFLNGNLLHRGIAPTTGERVIVEITLGPALKQSSRPVFAGMNSSYPFYPWSGAQAAPLSRTSHRLLPALNEPKPAKRLSLALVLRKVREKGLRRCFQAVGDRAKRLLAARAERTERQHLGLIHHANKLMQPGAVNLGGGPSFCALGWLNLEEVASAANPSSFRLAPNCTLPVPDASLHTVYTSHTLEHLPPATVDRLLNETHRALKAGGRLVIKIPDFDQVLSAWTRGEENFFSDELWNYNSVTHTWASRGIPDCLDYRVAMIFCGLWNDAYGDHFSGRVHKRATAYHGPPTVSRQYLRELFSSCSAGEISARLRTHVLKEEPDAHFNHQNAWGHAEMEELLRGHGFRVLSFTPELIRVACGDIPGISSMASVSMYCLATKDPAASSRNAEPSAQVFFQRVGEQIASGKG